MRKKRIGLIGLGRISDLHYRAYKDSSLVELAAIADCNRSLLEQRGRQWGVDLRFDDYRQLLARSDIDAVEILIPHPYHEEAVVAAAEAGKHISCQKPLTISLESAQRIVKLCQQRGVIFKLYENFLYYPPLQKARELLQAGMIGQPSAISIRLTAAGHGGWQVPATTWQWRAAETAAGRGQQTFDHGHHMWAMAIDLMGEVAQVGAQIIINNQGIDSPATVFWRHKDSNCLGSLHASYSKDLRIDSDYYSCDEIVEISGDRGVITINSFSGKLYYSRPAVQCYNQDGWHNFHCSRGWEQSFLNCSQNFFKALVGQEDPYPQAEFAYQVLAFALTVSASAKSQQFLTVPQRPLLVD